MAEALGDWLRGTGRGPRGLWGLGRVNNEVLRKVLEQDSRQEYTLDTDATIIESEKEDAQWTYKKEKGYQPLLGFLFEKGLVLHDEFRDGNVPAGGGGAGAPLHRPPPGLSLGSAALAQAPAGAL